MTPQMIAAMVDRTVPKTGLFEIGLPSGTRRLMIGAGECLWGADKYVGRDPTIGQVDTMDDPHESMDNVAPNLSVTIIPASEADRAQIGDPTIQLSPLKAYLAALQLDVNGHVVTVPDPELVFDGFIDQALFNLDSNRDELDYTVISVFDYFFEDNEGQRLNGAFHVMVFPGETGLNNVTAVTKKIYWGAYGPSGAQSAVSGSGGGSSGYGFGVGGSGASYGSRAASV
jgi:hypothetical protein